VDPDRIDLSPLDPSRDRVRWERIVRGVAARGAAARRRPNPVLAQVVAWWRPAMALAFAAALLAWAPAVLRPPGSASRGDAAAGADPVASTAWWALRERAPDAAELAIPTGASDDAR